MDNKMILKVFDIDYSFILKNYLDPKLWERKWTLFVYKNFIITLKLSYIYVVKKKITFELEITDNNSSSWNRSYDGCIEYSLNVDNIDILKKMINFKMLDLIRRVEKNLYIEETDEFYRLEELQNEERSKLEEIAKEFLDENDITNENIRDAYIDAYVDNTEIVYEKKMEYIDENKYRMLPGLYLAFARASKSKDLQEIVLEVNENKKDELLEEIEKLEEYIETEEFEEEAKNKLEEI